LADSLQSYCKNCQAYFFWSTLYTAVTLHVELDITSATVVKNYVRKYTEQQVLSRWGDMPLSWNGTECLHNRKNWNATGAVIVFCNTCVCEYIL